MFLNTRDAVGADVAVHLALARALDRTQCRVWAATGVYEAPEGDSARELFAAVPELTLLPLELGRPLSTSHGRARLAAAMANVRAIGSLAKLARLCRREGIDVIHVTDRPRDLVFGWLVSRLASKRLVVQAHTNYYRHDSSAVLNWILRRADAVVGVSRFTAASYVENGGLARERVFAVQNAVDTSLFNPGDSGPARLAMRARLNAEAEAPVMGCVARLMRWKRQATLLDAFASVRRHVPAAQLVLAGTSQDVSPDGRGSFQDYLVRRIAELGLEDSVQLVGFIPPADMPKFYAGLDLLVHPAVDEPFGLVLVEAMASGIPVVAVGAGGVPEIIRDGVDGLLVPAEQPNAMASAMLRVLEDSSLSARLAAAGRRRVVETFGGPRQAAEMLAVYRSLVSRGEFDRVSALTETLSHQER